MTNEEAIKTIRKMLSTTDLSVRANMTSNMVKACNMAIAALEKQIPKKPKYVEVDQTGMDMETGEEYTYQVDEAHCSCCDSIIV